MPSGGDDGGQLRQPFGGVQDDRAIRYLQAHRAPLRGKPGDKPGARAQLVPGQKSGQQQGIVERVRVGAVRPGLLVHPGHGGRVRTGEPRGLVLVDQTLGTNGQGAPFLGGVSSRKA